MTLSQYLLGCLVLVTLSACNGESSSASNEHTHKILKSPMFTINPQDATVLKNNKKRFEAKSTLILPDELTVTYYDESHGMDLYLRAKGKLDKKDFSSWIKSYSRQGKHFTTEHNYLLEPDEGEWRPSREKQLKTEQILFENGSVFNLGYVLNKDQTVDVYLVFHET